MEKLNKKSVTQIEALRIIDEKMNKEYVDFISSNQNSVKIVQFGIFFMIQEGSVVGYVYFDELGKLLKVPK